MPKSRSSRRRSGEPEQPRRIVGAHIELHGFHLKVTAKHAGQARHVRVLGRDLQIEPRPDGQDRHGAGQGDLTTPDSSIFIIKRDPFRSIRRGRQIFQRKFTVAQGFAPRTNDGIGNIELDGSLGAGLADSCAACHGRPRGSAGFGGNVFTKSAARLNHPFKSSSFR